MAPLLPKAVAFQRLVAQLGLAAAQRVASMWENTDGWEQVEEQYPAVIDPFAAAAGELAAQWYQDLAPDVPFEVRVSGLPDQGQLTATVGYAFTQKDTLSALVGSAERYIFGTARTTVLDNARRENVKYARHARQNACEWCQVLATNEPRYYTEESAIAGHDRCYCVAVPVRDDEVWRPAPYVEGWKDAYNKARGEVGGNLDDITNYLRKQSYPDRKDALNARRRELYADKRAAETAESED